MGQSRPTGKDKEIIEYLIDHPRSSPSMIAVGIDTSEQHVRNRVRELSRRNFVTRPARGIYEATDEAIKTIDK